MAQLDAELTKQKLNQLQDTQASIESLSTWCIFYRRNSEKVCSLWLEVVDAASQGESKSATADIIALFHLANHILQKSKTLQKSSQAGFLTEYLDAFAAILPQAISSSLKVSNPSSKETIRNKLKRLLDVWASRSVYSTDFIGVLRKSLD